MAPEREEGGQDEELRGDDDEEGEEEEEAPRGSPGGPGSSVAPPPPPSPLASQKGHLASTHSCSPLDLIPFRKKTRDLPNLCNCHSCGLRFPDKGRGERLQPLDSQWRIVLLCNACLWAVRSAEVCSYCFVGFVGRGEGFGSCRECSCRVHVECLPEQRGYLAPSDLDPDLFTCVDCCAFPISRIRKNNRFRDSSAARVPDLAMDNVAKNAESADVKNEAVAEIVVAKNATDLARGALDLVLAEKLPTCAAIPDEELALQLHRAMNGSQRISRSLCSVNSDRLIDDKRGLSNVNLLDKGPESGNCSMCGEVELCTEDALFETMEIIDAEPLNVIGASESNFIVNLGRVQEKYQSKEVTQHRKGDATEMPAREEQASCSDKFVNFTEDNNSFDYASASASCPRPGEPNTAASQQGEKHSMPDRYMKKYCKRPPRTKER